MGPLLLLVLRIRGKNMENETALGRFGLIRLRDIGALLFEDNP